MKRSVVFIFLIVNALITTQAQQPITIYEDSIQFSSGKYPGLVVTIPEATYEAVQKGWEKRIESGTKSKAVYENGEWSIFGAMLKSISPNPVNIYSKLVSQDSLLQLLVSCELKKDKFIEKGSSEAELATAKTLLKDFAKEQYMALAKDQLDLEQNKLKDLEKELSSLEKDESDFEKAIRSAESTIKSENDNQIVLNNQLTSLSGEIISQSASANALEDGSAKEERLKYVQNMEKEKKKLLNDIESSKKKVSRAESDIDNADSEIPKNQSLQEEVQYKIDAQKAVVTSFEDKLKTISEF